MIYNIFLMDMTSLFTVLFWANLISLMFAFTYCVNNKSAKELKLPYLFMAARLCHAFYYFAAVGRGVMPDMISVNLGIIALLAGFYCEAQAMLRLIKEYTKKIGYILIILFASAVLIFGVTEYAVHTGESRIVTASLGTVIIMLLPVMRMLLSRDAGAFARSASGLYLVFLLLLLIRVYNYGILNEEGGILTNNLLQSATFLALLLQLIISLPTYTLVLNGYSNEALYLMATTDRLTGATNRHAFIDAAKAIFKSSMDRQTSLALIFIDIDFFKRVNDRFGHAFGDAVLSRTAQIIDKSLRESDLSCRYGGEEFVVMLPRTDEASAQVVIRRIMDGVREARFEEQPDFSFTISAGVFCRSPERGQNFNSLLDAADQAMYKAKRDGRNRVVFQTSPISNDGINNTTARTF